MTPTTDTDKIRSQMLGWYDRQGRDLPWRAKGNKRPDPYHVWLSEIMCQQTTIPAVMPYFLKFISKWPSVHDLAAAPQDDVMHEWAGLGYYARARNLHKCAKIISYDLNGAFPATAAELKKLPGIGDYTSAAIAAIVFDEPAPVIDGNVERVAARMFAFAEALPGAKTRLKKTAEQLYDGNRKRPGDLAQAYMDLGAMICTPTSPKCALCPVNGHCQAYHLGIAPELPRKEAKKAKPKRYGHYYWITNDEGAILFERRNEDRMMGGMLALPTTDWDLKRETSTLKLDSPQKLSENYIVRHSFTHFDLELQGYTANFSPDDPRFIWVDAGRLDGLGLPSLFKKAVKLMI